MMYETEIKLDIDEKPKKLRVFIREMVDRFVFFIHNYEFKLWLKSIRVKETEKGFHFYFVVYSCRKLKDIEIIYMQLALGSDYKREGFNTIRSAEGNTDIELWNMLFIDKERDTKRSEFIQSFFFNELYEKLINKKSNWYDFLKLCGVSLDKYQLKDISQ